MIQYLVRRTLQSVPLLVIISVLLFTILQLQPEKPWDLLLHRPNLTAAARAHILRYYDFEKPVWYQYFLCIWHLVHHDFATSSSTSKGTLDLAAQRLPT